jgi:hypothetical protein
MKKALLTLVLAALVAIPAAALDQTIYNGIDLWMTLGDGSTFRDFADEPIPAGFFCAGSAPFGEKIIFRGVPVVTGNPGELGITDTIVQRLDDATFNRKGVAHTRIQVRALSFEAVAPIKTSCGLFKVTVALDGVQPVTRMRIIRDDELGGRFLSPIWVNVKLMFTPVGRVRTGETLELTRSLRFAPNPQAAWSSLPPPGVRTVKGFVTVDTDGDSVPETFLPGTSNFVGGWSARKATAVPICHCDSTCYYKHCTYLLPQLEEPASSLE